MQATQRVFEAHVSVDPRSSTRRFSILTSDYGLQVVGAPWSALVVRLAPAMRLAFTTLAMEAISPPEVRLRDVEGAIAPHGFVPDSMPHIDVCDDRWVILADGDNTRLSAVPSMDELAQLPWASAFEGPVRTPAGLHRGEWARMVTRLSVVVDTFAAIPRVVRGTDRVALVQERLISALGLDGLRVVEPPVHTEPIRLAFWWHPTYTGDPEHRWLRGHLGPLRERFTQG